MDDAARRVGKREHLTWQNRAVVVEWADDKKSGRLIIDGAIVAIIYYGTVPMAHGRGAAWWATNLPRNMAHRKPREALQAAINHHIAST